MALVKKFKKWGKRGLLGVGVSLGLYTSTIPIACTIIGCVSPKQKTVVFSAAGRDHYGIPENLVTKFIDFWMYSPVTLRQNLDGNKTDWYSNPTKEIVLENLSNPDYQNVVFMLEVVFTVFISTCQIAS